MNSHLPLGVGFFHNGQKSVNLIWWRRGKVNYFDVMQLQLWTCIVVWRFSFTQANKVFDSIVQQVLVLWSHPGQSQTSQFSWFHPREVVGSEGSHGSQPKARKTYCIDGSFNNTSELYVITDPFRPDFRSHLHNTDMSAIFALIMTVSQTVLVQM